MLLFFGSDDEDLPQLEAYGRLLVDLLPPGRLWKLLGDTLLKRFLLAPATELARVHERAVDLYREAFISTADELLEEWEADYDLAPAEGDTDAVRQARVLARMIQRQRVRPADYQSSLAGLLGQEVGDVVVIERTNASALAMGGPGTGPTGLGHEREVYRFLIYRDPAEPGSYDLAGAQALIDEIHHSNTLGQVIESIDFLCDDEFSLCDRDLLGA
jgi:hypothetical protein